ncbi:hypothetical protein [Ekhidna sp.]
MAISFISNLMYLLPTSVRSIKFDKNIWSSVLTNANQLVLDIRNEEGTDIDIITLDIDSLVGESIPIEPINKWMKLIGIKNHQLYFIRYLDTNDPSSNDFLMFDPGKQLLEPVTQLPHFTEPAVYAQIYEHGSEYFKTVAEFLGLELPLSCEYLEWNDKIIISYYLRSDNGFDRYLLLLRDGMKEWKIKQDESMKGFSSGAFFVVGDQLIFIKDRNEVCVYAD